MFGGCVNDLGHKEHWNKGNTPLGEQPHQNEDTKQPSGRKYHSESRESRRPEEVGGTQSPRARTLESRRRRRASRDRWGSSVRRQQKPAPRIIRDAICSRSQSWVGTNVLGGGVGTATRRAFGARVSEQLLRVMASCITVRKLRKEKKGAEACRLVVHRKPEPGTRISLGDIASLL